MDFEMGRRGDEYGSSRIQQKTSFDEFMKGLRSFRTGEGEQAFSDEYHVITNKEKNFWLETYESEGYIELGDYESAYVNEHDVIQVEK